MPAQQKINPSLHSSIVTRSSHYLALTSSEVLFNLVSQPRELTSQSIVWYMLHEIPIPILSGIGTDTDTGIAPPLVLTAIPHVIYSMLYAY